MAGDGTAAGHEQQRTGVLAGASQAALRSRSAARDRRRVL